MSLSEEIKENSKKVHTTDIAMSIGEIINMYRDNEIIIKPEFQRLFRWSIEQKSRFIESILIGIPIPSIFIQQLENGKWEVVDGLQRISTILEFAGVLIDENNKPYPRSELVKTKFLPSLEGMTYESFEEKENQKTSNKYFDNETKLIFKRTRLIFQIIRRDSSNSTKYELFDRLNSGGTPLTDQEIRNAIFLLENPEAIKFVKRLSKNKHFNEIIYLSEGDMEKAFNEELVLRFLAYVTIPDKITYYNSSVKEFLDGYLREHFNINDIQTLEYKFSKFFEFLDKNFSYEIFRRKNKKGFLGKFKISKFEALVIGLFPHLEKLNNNIDLIRKKIEEIEKEKWFIEESKQGSQIKSRISKFHKNAPKYFEV